MQTRDGRIPEALLSALPARARVEILSASARIGRPEEIRLRAGRRASLTLNGKNHLLPLVLTSSEMEAVLASLCENSLYAHRDTISQGYVTLKCGARVGVCGRASVDGGRIIGVYDINALNIRVPAELPPDIGGEICALLDEMKYTKGVLIYSPPGVGKTTLLRSVAMRLSGSTAPRRVVLVDTRGELSPGMEQSSLCLDALVGYPKAAGIEIATRTLGAEVIICDEIGGREELDALLFSHNSGVPLICSAHAWSLRELYERQGFERLIRSGSIGRYVGIRRKEGELDFEYDISDGKNVS